ncbi:MAG: GNAT family N-acetyltransferase [Alphaproteobacteria bacterium]
MATPPENRADPPREANEADLAMVRTIYAHHVETGLGTFEETAPSIDEITRRWRRACELRLPYLIVERDNAVRGFAYARPYRARSAYRYTVEDSVYVDANWQRRGIASLLLEGLISRCGALGYRQMVAVIGGSANVSSINLHASHGFREVGILRGVGDKFGAPVDSVLMQRALPGAENPAPGKKIGPRGYRATQV